MTEHINALTLSQRSRSWVLKIWISAVIISAIPTTKATNWQANIKPGSDIVMNDLRWPVWDAGTYYCFWYMSFYPKFSSLYGGVAVHGPKQLPGMFTSYWCVTETIYEGPEFYGKGFGAEGSKGGANGAPAFQRPNSWYRMVMRTFPPTKGADKKTLVGWWIKDVEKNRWHTHSILSIPEAVTGFQANSGFVEALAPESTPRAFERRLGYCRLNGKWYDSPLSANDERKFKLINDSTVVRFNRTGPDGGAKKEQTFFPTKQSPAPALDKLLIDQATAYRFGNQVTVEWRIPSNSSPQLGYKLEVFDNANAEGLALVTWEDAAPHILKKRLDTKSPAKSVKLTVTDIFDQQTTKIIPVNETTIPLTPKIETTTRAGLEYQYYENLTKNAWKTLPDFSIQKPVKVGYLKTLDDTIKEDRNTEYAIRFKGYLRVPSDGLYTLSIGTRDGNRLFLDGTLIAENNGIHSTSPKLHSLKLRQGLRPFELEYFKGRDSGNSKQSTTAKIAASWEGPGFEMRKLTTQDFRCEERPNSPAVFLKLQNPSSPEKVKDNLVKLQIEIESRGQSAQKLQLFGGKVLLKTKLAADFDEEGHSEINILLPEGQNQLWARLWFNEGNSIDSLNELSVSARNRISEPWDFNRMLKGDFPLAVRGDVNSVAFRGEGYGFVHQTITGDFTLTGRIASMPLTSKENGLWTSNWLGLSVLAKHPNPKVRLTDKGPYNSEISLFLTAEGKMKGGKDFPDLAGTNKSIASFEGEHRWLRLVRRGRRYQSFTSADGNHWHLADERFSSKASKEVYAGVCFRSGPNKSRSLFEGYVDHLKIEANASPEKREKTNKEDLNLKNRITALVQASDRPEILYARTVGQGIVKSSDHGETWNSANRNLTPLETLTVRSVAVDPENSAIVLRGCGKVVNGQQQSGLWRSNDGGDSWKLVTRKIDFNGQGPTSMFGEVIQFFPLDPQLVVAGGESKGLFISRNAGKTWSYAGLAGERITCMAFCPSPDKNTKAPILVVGTCADSEFQTLQLGTPFTPLKNPGKIYSINLSQSEKPHKINQICELKNFGFTNMVFDTERNFMNFATTRGVFYTWAHGGRYAKREVGSARDRLFMALGTRPFDSWSLLTCSAPFSGGSESPVHFTSTRSRNWSKLSQHSLIESGESALALNAGISCLLPDRNKEDTFYLCNRHGVFKTINKGQTYKLVLKTEPN